MPERMTRAVNNKDIIILQEAKYLMNDVLEAEKRIAWISARRRSVTQHISAVPGGSGNGRAMDDAVAALDEQERIIRALLKIYNRKQARADAILNSIKSGQMRDFVRMMYVQQLSDSAVREKLGMSRWAFDYARKIVEEAERMEHVKWRDRYIAKE